MSCSRRRCGGRQRPGCSRDPGEGPRGTPYRGAWPGRAGRGRAGSSDSGFPAGSPPRRKAAQHSSPISQAAQGAHGFGSSASGLRLLGQRRPTPRPAPRPARRAAALGLGDWGGGGGARRRGERSARPVRSLVGLRAALRACSGRRVWVPPAPHRQSRVRERDTRQLCQTRGGETRPCRRGARISPGARLWRGRSAPSFHSQAPCVPTLAASPRPPVSLGLRSAAPPQTRGCLFLLGLSMLSLFGRLCHRLDAGNKV